MLEVTFHLKRFFVSLPEPLAAFPAELTVEDEFVVHHLRTVMRAKVGESAVLVDGERRQAYLGTLQALEKRSVSLTVESRLETPEHRLPSVTLAMALIKEQRWDAMLQKATELGVEVIQPIASERTVIRLDGKDIAKKLERWESVMRSAAEQSEGLFIPRILPPLSVDTLCGHSDYALFQRILLAERGKHRNDLKTQLAQAQANQPILFAIGPEGGWTDRELGCFESAGYTFASLGQRIMRSETAAIAAMASVVYEFGSQ